MAKQRQKAPGRGWFTKTDAAAVFGITEAFFDRYYRKLAPDDAVKDVDGRLWFKIRPIIDALVKSEGEKVQAAKPEPSADPLMVGPDSPALEEYRRERVLMIRMDRMEREGVLVPREELDPALDVLAGAYRRAGDVLQKRYGAEALKIVERAVKEAADRWGEMFGSANGGGGNPDPGGNGANGGADPATRPANAAGVR